jgi:hypothetical protein
MENLDLKNYSYGSLCLVRWQELRMILFQSRCEAFFTSPVTLSFVNIRTSQFYHGIQSICIVFRFGVFCDLSSPWISDGMQWEFKIIEIYNFRGARVLVCVCCLEPLEHCDRGFDSRSRHVIFCRVVLRRYRLCHGPIPYPRDLPTRLQVFIITLNSLCFRTGRGGGGVDV